MAQSYDKLVQRYTEWLTSDNVERRRQAAMMVGELGVAESIETLLELARKDKDATVRKNAQYSLGMFAAFKQAVDGGEDSADAAFAALQRVAETGKIGRRATPTTEQLKRRRGSLVLLLLGMITANVFAFRFFGLPNVGGLTAQIPVLNRPTPVPAGFTPQPDTALDVLVSRARGQMNILGDSLSTVQRQLQPVLSGGSPAECNAFFDPSLQAIVISDNDRLAYPPVGLVYDELNAALGLFTETRARIEAACYENQPITLDEAVQYSARLAAYQNESVGSMQFRLENPANTPTPVPTATQTPTATPTQEPTATATESFLDVRNSAASLLDVIDSMNSVRGPTNLLKQYWTEAQQNRGDTDGCREVLTIPGDPFGNPTALEKAPELQQALDLVIAGLNSLRESNTRFQSACRSSAGQVVSEAPAGLTAALNAEGQLNEARAIVETLLRSLGN